MSDRGRFFVEATSVCDVRWTTWRLCLVRRRLWWRQGARPAGDAAAARAIRRQWTRPRDANAILKSQAALVSRSRAHCSFFYKAHFDHLGQFLSKNKTRNFGSSQFCSHFKNLKFLDSLLLQDLLHNSKIYEVVSFRAKIQAIIFGQNLLKMVIVKARRSATSSCSWSPLGNVFRSFFRSQQLVIGHPD